jgi:AraC-like DNA-binding protein
MEQISLQDLLFDFYQISGMEIAIIDRQLHALAECRPSGETFCTSIHKSPKCLKMCLQSDSNGFREVERSQRAYLYTCPFGFFEAIVPVMEKDKIKGYLILSLGLNASFLQKQSPVDIALFHDNSLGREQLETDIRTAPVSPSERISSYLRLMEVMAEHISNHHLLPEENQTLGERICRYIDRNLNRKITLAELSRSLHRSTVTLTEHFRQSYGMSVMQYVLQKRIELAKRMLLESELPVYEIAVRCGFSDAEYFSRCFKEEAGESPALWRRLKKESFFK